MKVSEAEDAKEVSIVKNANSWTLGWKSTGDGSCADRSEAIGTLITPSNWDFVVPISSPLRGHVTGAPTYPQFAKSWNKANFLGHSLKVCCKLVSYIV